MTEILIYCLKVMVIQGLLYLIYRLAFHRSGRHTLNRAFIISALILSLIIPLISLLSILPNKMVEEQTHAKFWLVDAEIDFAEMELMPVAKEKQSTSAWYYLPLVLTALSFLLLVRSALSFYQLRKVKRQSQLVEKSWYSLFKSKVETPFSFFKNIFIPERLFNNSAYDQILAHECVHAKKWHSLDRVLIQILVCVFWFNPLLYMYRKALVETHEFEADEGVINRFKDRLSYQEILYQQLTVSSPAGVVSHFNFSTIKKRIKMMNKIKKQPIWLYSFTMPVFIGLALIFSNNTPNKMVQLSDEVVIPISEVFSPTEQYRPSIFPLRNSDKVKMTSGFGKRIHPVLKKEKMHNGIDLTTEEGNIVLATADGTVSFAGEDGDYGIKIIIDHNGLYETLYAHLSQLNVKMGDKVERGDEVGLSGSTGLSQASHLHYEVIEFGAGHVNPTDFIDDYKFDTGKKSMNEPIKKSSVKKYKVVIDPGHGGADKGIGSSHLFEKEIVMNIANQLALRFSESHQIELILTREDDRLVSLEDRMKMTEGADLFISLHVEKHEDKEEDFMLPIYLDSGNFVMQSQRLAKLLAYELGQKEKKVQVGQTAGYYVLKNAKCPAVLFNVGFVSNENADRYLNSKEGQEEIARELSDAIELAVL